MLEYKLEKEVISRYANSHKLLKNTQIRRIIQDSEIWLEVDALGNMDKGSELWAIADEIALPAANLGMAKVIIITQFSELYGPPIGVYEG